MVKIPTCLKALADVTGEGGSRFATGGVRVEPRPGGVAVRATDTKVAVDVTVEGDAAGPPVTVPAGDWRVAFAAADKATKRLPAGERVVTVAPEGERVTLAATGLGGETRATVEPAAGRYPDFDPIFAATTADVPVATVSLDPARLAALLKVLTALQASDASRIDIEIRKLHQPVLFRVPYPADGVVSVRAILMPLAG